MHKKVVLNEVELMLKQYLTLARFRAIVRMVIQNIHWVKECIILHGKSEVVRQNIVEIFTNVFSKTATLSLEDKYLLFRPIESRTPEEKKYIYKMMGDLKLYKNFPLNTRKQMSCCVKFITFDKNHFLVKKDRIADAMYLIVDGMILQKGDEHDHDVFLHAGKTIGVSELYFIEPHKFSYITMTAVELLYIDKEDYQRVLSETVHKHWNEIKNAMSLFNYFSGYSERQMKEAYQHCDVKHFKSNDIIFGDGHGVNKCVYFIMSGSCQFIDMLYIKSVHAGNNTSYSLFESEGDWTEDMKSEQSLKTIEIPISPSASCPYTSSNNLKSMKINSFLSNSKLFGSSFALSSKATTPAASKIHRHFHSNLPNNVEPVFMQSYLMYEGGCFNLGELFNDRRVVAIGDVQCLIITRNWLFAQNVLLFWDRIKRFVENHTPSKRQLLQEYRNMKKVQKYNKKIVNEILQQRTVKQVASVYDVPLTVRIFDKYSDSKC